MPEYPIEHDDLAISFDTEAGKSTKPHSQIVY
jgi:hypothetical protein